MPESTEEPVLFSQESQLDEASDSNVIQFNHTNGCQSFKIKIDPHSVYHVGFNQIIGGDHIRIYDPVRSQNKQPQLIRGHHADIKIAASGIWLIQFGRSGSRISRGDVTKYVTSGTMIRLQQGDSVSFGADLTDKDIEYVYLTFNVEMPNGKTFGCGPHTPKLKKKTAAAAAAAAVAAAAAAAGKSKKRKPDNADMKTEHRAQKKARKKEKREKRDWVVQITEGGGKGGDGIGGSGGKGKGGKGKGGKGKGGKGKGGKGKGVGRGRFAAAAVAAKRKRKQQVAQTVITEASGGGESKFPFLFNQILHCLFVLFRKHFASPCASCMLRSISGGSSLKGKSCYCMQSSMPPRRSLAVRCSCIAPHWSEFRRVSLISPTR
jgi:hypothetical protein